VRRLRMKYTCNGAGDLVMTAFEWRVFRKGMGGSASSAHIRTHTGQFDAWRFRMKVREQRRETRDYDMKDTQRLRVRSNAL
jgi:hypothetical protein